jgi:hypothetical protein
MDKLFIASPAKITNGDYFSAKIHLLNFQPFKQCVIFRPKSKQSRASLFP